GPQSDPTRLRLASNGYAGLETAKAMRYMARGDTSAHIVSSKQAAKCIKYFDQCRQCLNRVKRWPDKLRISPDCAAIEAFFNTERPRPDPVQHSTRQAHL